MYGFVTFYKKPDIEGLKKILPYCVEMHGKFHYVRDLHEHSIPYEDILPIIRGSEYAGYIMSEYEDHNLYQQSARQMDRFIRMEKKLLGMP